MKVGILNAITMERDHIHWNDTPVDAYIRFFQSGGATCEFVGYQVHLGQFPDSVEACDAYVITGSPRGVYDDDPWLETLAQFIRASYQAGKKLIGICFGHQILAHALGGHAEKSEKGWGLGLQRIEISQSLAWMDEQPAECALYFVHQDQVTRLPPGAESLGGSDFCPHAFYVIGQQALGIQGHPEFTPTLMGEIVDSLESRLTTEDYSTAVESLQSGQPDNQVVARWLVNFLLDESG